MIAISIPPEYDTAISINAHPTLALQRLEEEEVQNLEKKEHMTMRDGEFATMIQHKEEEEAQKSMEKEHHAMSSTLTGKALLLIQRVLSLHHFLQSSITQNLGFASKVITVVTASMFFFADHLLHLQTVFRVAGKMPLCM